jgi:hypothetical protein
MRIIITGGSGLIGRALTASLAADKHEVIVLSRDPEWVVGLPKGARAVQWDGRSAAGWGSLADGADAIVNLAGESVAGESILSMRWTAARKKRILESRLNAGKAVVEAVRSAKNKPKVLIQSSAVGYYGPRNGADLEEDAPAGNDFLANVCKQWEAATAEVEKLGVRRAIIRTGVVLSTEGGVLPLQMLPFKLFAGGPIGSGAQAYPWIHIADEVGAIRFLIETEAASGVFNLTAPEPLNNKEFGQVLGRVMGRPAFIPTPGFVFKIAFGEVSTLLLDGQRPIPSRLTGLGYQFKFPAAEAALRDLLGQKG